MKRLRRFLLLLGDRAGVLPRLRVAAGAGDPAAHHAGWRRQRGHRPAHPPRPLHHVRAAGRPPHADPICVINEQGFRHPVTVPREKTRPRVFVLGGSFAFGAGGAREDAYYLAHVRRAFPELEFINAAGSSFVARQQLVHLALNVMPLHPDADADRRRLQRPRAAHGVRPGAGRALAVARVRARSCPAASGASCAATTRPAASCTAASAACASTGQRHQPRLPRAHLIPPSAPSTPTPPSVTYDSRGPAACRCSTCSSRNWPSEGAQRRRRRASACPRSRRACARCTPQLADVARGCAASNQVPFLSLLGLYSNVTDQVYVDYCHVNDRGQQMAGEAIADFLKAQSLEPSSPARTEQYGRSGEEETEPRINAN
jgi:hypothetical protein